jgi:predicted metal-dependent phosphoesterase TrpH
MIVDLHVHTTYGSADSNLTPQELLQEAQRIGLDGACLTEHGRPWDRFGIQQLTHELEDLLIVPALEIESTVGHITVFGLDRYVSGIRDPIELRRIADKVGAYVVLAHPFRNMFLKKPMANNLLFQGRDPMPTTVEEVIKHPIFELVNAIEVANGGNSNNENKFAWDVAQHLGKPMVGGSDAHSIHGLGRCVTVFPKRISSATQFLEALHTGNFYPATGLSLGNLQRFPSCND